MANPLLLASFLLLVSTACTPAQRYWRLDSEFEVSAARLDSIVVEVYHRYSQQPGSIEPLAAELCGNGTFRRLDSLCSQQHELLLHMADCCPRALNRHLVSRVEQHCDLRHAAAAAGKPFAYREFDDSKIGAANAD